jgi:outer membrane protein
MKNLSLILNGVLAVAVAVLFYLQLADSSPKQTGAAGTESPGNLSVAFVNSDSILSKYDYFTAERTKLEAKGKKLDSDLRNRAQSLQNEIQSYQQNVANLTIGQAKAIEEDLGKKQQNLRLYQEQLSQELMNEQSRMNEELYKKITEFLKKYGEEKGLQIVFKFDTSSDLLYGAPALDITADVVSGLNEAYAAETKKTPADSVKTKK